MVGIVLGTYMPSHQGGATWHDDGRQEAVGSMARFSLRGHATIVLEHWD